MVFHNEPRALIQSSFLPHPFPAPLLVNEFSLTWFVHSPHHFPFLIISLPHSSPCPVLPTFQLFHIPSRITHRNHSSTSITRPSTTSSLPLSRIPYGQQFDPKSLFLVIITHFYSQSHLHSTFPPLSHPISQITLVFPIRFKSSTHTPPTHFHKYSFTIALFQHIFKFPSKSTPLLIPLLLQPMLYSI